MGRRDWDDEPDEGDDATGYDDDGDDLVEPCPACGADVYEDADRCPACGDFITRSTSPWKGKPIPWIVLGLLGIGAVLWGTLGPLLG